MTYDWSLVPAPVIAAIHGNCFGGGLQIALGADIRIAAPDAKLSIMEVKWGLVPDMGITQTLPRLVPIDVAKEMTFSGRIRFWERTLRRLDWSPAPAEDPLASALALAEEIAQKSPDAVQAAKRLYNETWVSDDAAAALALESELQTGLIGKPNQIAAVVAGMSGEKPVFADPGTERRADGMGALDGRVAFITGGARGQGRAHALALAAEGANIAIADAPRPMNLTYPLGTEDDLRGTAKQVEELGGRLPSDRDGRARLRRGERRRRRNRKQLGKSRHSGGERRES